MLDILRWFFIALWLAVGVIIASYGLRGLVARRIVVPGYSIIHGIIRLRYAGAAAILLGLGIAFVGLALALSTLGALIPESPLAQTFGAMCCGSLPLLAVITLIVWRRFNATNAADFE